MREKYNINTVHQPCLTDKSNVSRVQNPRFGWSSSNWSGYAFSSRKGTFHCISAEWIVPYVRPTSKSTYSSAWIGIDGFKNTNLIQTGTGHEYINGSAYYYAWWEILPDFETVIPLPVRPGDHMKATIKKIKNRTKWSITLRNLSRKWTFRTMQHYAGPQASAEWIMEAPQVDGIIAKLARVSPTFFFCCRINGKNPRLTPAAGGIMIQNNITVASPSYPKRGGGSFVVRRTCLKRAPLDHSKIGRKKR